MGAASLSGLFDSIKLQYQMILDYFHLENLGIISVQGVKDPGDIEGNTALDEAYHLGMSVE